MSRDDKVTGLSEDDCALSGTVRIVNVLEAPNTSKESMLRFSDKNKRVAEEHDKEHYAQSLRITNVVCLLLKKDKTKTNNV